MYYFQLIILSSILCVCCSALPESSHHAKQLHKDLFKDYRKEVRPVINATHSLNVTMQFWFMQLLKVDEIDQILTVYAWVEEYWRDEFLTWDPKMYGGITTIRVPADMVWRPDILVYNNADMNVRENEIVTNVVLNFTGDMVCFRANIIKIACSLDMTYFPFDLQKCSMMFASWTYDGARLRITPHAFQNNLDYYIENTEWKLLNFCYSENVKYYSCCPEPFIDITYRFVLERNPSYYTLNLIIPSILITIVTMVGFFTPHSSTGENTEKVSLGVTALLSLAIILLMVADKMPATSKVIPLIGKYYMGLIFLIFVAAIVTTGTLRIQSRGNVGRPLPRPMKRAFFDIIAPCLLMELDITTSHRYPRKLPVSMKQQEIVAAGAGSRLLNKSPSVRKRFSSYKFSSSKRVTDDAVLSNTSPILNYNGCAKNRNMATESRTGYTETNNVTENLSTIIPCQTYPDFMQNFPNCTPKSTGTLLPPGMMEPNLELIQVDSQRNNCQLRAKPNNAPSSKEQKRVRHILPAKLARTKYTISESQQKPSNIDQLAGCLDGENEKLVGNCRTPTPDGSQSKIEYSPSTTSKSIVRNVQLADHSKYASSIIDASKDDQKVSSPEGTSVDCGEICADKTVTRGRSDVFQGANNGSDHNNNGNKTYVHNSDNESNCNVTCTGKMYGTCDGTSHCFLSHPPLINSNSQPTLIAGRLTREQRFAEAHWCVEMNDLCHELHQLTSELKYRIVAETKLDAVRKDWEQLARVMERLLMYIFIIGTVSFALFVLQTPENDWLLHSRKLFDMSLGKTNVSAVGAGSTSRLC